MPSGEHAMVYELKSGALYIKFAAPMTEQIVTTLIVGVPTCSGMCSMEYKFWALSW